MLLNDLASLARGAGLTVTEAPNWIGHNHGQLSSVECIVIHHTAGPSTGDYPSYNTVRNGRPGLEGPLAQLGVGRSGRLYVFSNGVAWHAGAVKESWMDNYHAIGIEVESVGTGPEWPSVQVHAAAKLTAALCKRYGVPVSRVLGHKEVCYPVGRKIDPVGIPGDMPAFRALVQQYISGTAQKESEVELTDKWDEKVLNSRPGTVGHALLNMKQNLTAVRQLVTAQSATISALTKLVSDGDNGLTEAQVKAAVQAAIAESVVNVDIDISGNPVA
jgi:hypothetical protein